MRYFLIIVLCVTIPTISNADDKEENQIMDSQCVVVNVTNTPSSLIKQQDLNTLCPYTNRTFFIDFKSSNLQNFPKIVFDVFAHLKSLDLSKSNIQHIDSTSFEKATNLVNLYMSRNNVSTITNYLFKGASKLNVLDMSSANISTIEVHAFLGLSLLTSLDLSSNRIKKLEEGIFDALTRLDKIRLSDNRIEILDDKLFLRNTFLKSVYLNSNKIIFVDPNTFTRTIIRFVDLSDNPIASIDISNLNLLKEILLSGTDLTTLNIPRNLTDINLGNSRITSINSSNEQNVLKKLDLSKNHFTNIQDLSVFVNLENVDLSYNHIKLFEFVQISTLNKLKQLNLIGATFKRQFNRSELLKTLPDIEVLTISSNNWPENYIMNLKDELKENNIYLIIGDANATKSDPAENKPNEAATTIVPTTIATKPPQTTKATTSTTTPSIDLDDLLTQLDHNLTILKTKRSEIFNEINQTKTTSIDLNLSRRIYSLTEEMLTINEQLMGIIKTKFQSDHHQCSNKPFVSTNCIIFEILLSLILGVGLIILIVKLVSNVRASRYFWSRYRQRVNSSETLHPIFEQDL